LALKAINKDESLHTAAQNAFVLHQRQTISQTGGDVARDLVCDPGVRQHLF